ncbi:hypothetical protein [Klebsiella variicola]|uniref:hypothetical protein n=1 Tax=Klebsiella variicola TaxID=244366 RepID=UPI0011591925|nr:hypothetical protein [Klebsiella variicola]
MANPILIIGGLDPLAFRVKNFARQAGIPCDTLTGKCLLEVQGAEVNKNLDNCYIKLKNDYIYPKKYAGILSGYICDIINGDSDMVFQNPTLERYWSEWNSFIGTILSLHPNVLNPPFYGALNGHQPSIFWQITAITRAKGIIIPSIQLIAESIKPGDPKELHHFYSVSEDVITKMISINSKNLEPQLIQVIFVDNEIICSTSLSNSEFQTIMEVTSILKSEFSVRLGEINITKYKSLLYFRSFITRPNISSLPWKQQILTLNKIVTTLSGDGRDENSQYTNNC